MRKFLFQLNKSFKLRQRIVKARLMRLFHNTSLNKEQCFRIPIIINNRNRFTFLKQLVESLEQRGYSNIIILDNDSTYEPLLTYYKQIRHEVIFLKKNLGYKALWISGVFERFKNSWYVYTDSDVLPQFDCPNNFLQRLYEVLKKHRRFEKAGVALKIDDIPDHYSHKAEVLRVETPYWKKEIDENVFEAPVDTTFALYRPFASGDAEECPACRVGGKLSFLHQPWYENSASPSEEDFYYRKSVAGQSSYWLNLQKK